MYTGECQGGPLLGRRFSSAFPKGFLVVNRPARQIAIYEWESNCFVVRENDTGDWRLPEVDDPNEAKNRYRAALEPNYDVFAYDPERMGKWDR